VAWWAKHLGIIEPVASVSSFVVNIEIFCSCASCHNFSPFDSPVGLSSVRLRLKLKRSTLPQEDKSTPPFSGYFFFLTVSVTVVCGWFFAYPGFTNLPLMALRLTFTFLAIFFSFCLAEALRL
jgi:hypothetical protein